ncbi:MAG: hypothetical protein ACOYYS_06625 [Chloroflexota bacterium]
MQTVKEFPYLKVMWDEETRSMISQWYGGHIGRNIKEGLDVALEEYKKKLPGAQWIGDTTDIGVIGLEEQAWIDKDWFPRFLATEVQFMAVVQPKSAVAKMMVDQIVSKVPGTRLTIFNCASLEEARAWMMKQKF